MRVVTCVSRDEYARYVFARAEKNCAVEGLACEKVPAVEKRRESVTTRCLQTYVCSVSSEFKHASKHV